MSIALQVALVMVTILVVLLVIGAPIGVAIGMSSAVSMICMIPADVSFATSAQRIFAGSNSFSLIAIPFFILAGMLQLIYWYNNTSCRYNPLYRLPCWWNDNRERYKDTASLLRSNPYSIVACNIYSSDINVPSTYTWSCIVLDNV